MTPKHTSTISQVERKLNLLVDQCELIDVEIRREEMRLKSYRNKRVFRVPAEMRMLILKGVYETYFINAHRTGVHLTSLLLAERLSSE